MRRKALAKMLITTVTLYFLGVSNSKSLPFEGLPDDLHVIITKDGHSTPHKLGATKH
jgi:hypothetical protein